LPADVIDAAASYDFRPRWYCILHWPFSPAVAIFAIIFASFADISFLAVELSLLLAGCHCNIWCHYFDSWYAADILRRLHTHRLRWASCRCQAAIGCMPLPRHWWPPELSGWAAFSHDWDIAEAAAELMPASWWPIRRQPAGQPAAAAPLAGLLMIEAGCRRMLAGQLTAGCIIGCTDIASAPCHLFFFFDCHRLPRHADTLAFAYCCWPAAAIAELMAGQRLLMLLILAISLLIQLILRIHRCWWYAAIASCHTLRHCIATHRR